MPSSLAQAIRNARLAVGLNQEQLARYLRLKARAVSRWELDRNVPRGRHRAALVALIRQLNPAAGDALATAFAAHPKRGVRVVQVLTPVAPPPDPKVTFELALFAFAEELDVPARRARIALARLLERFRETKLTFEVAKQQLQSSLES